MALHHIKGVRVRTTHEYPPIPIRSFDWSAVNDDTYDCDCDQDGFFSTSPVGHGATEQEAIADLLEQIAPEEWVVCERCDGEGVSRRNIWVYDHGCGFPREDVEELPCDHCKGAGGFICEAEGDR